MPVSNGLSRRMWATWAARIMILEGTQPTLTQVPPIVPRSISTRSIDRPAPVSGLSGDLRELHAAAASASVSSAVARLVIAMFCASVRKQIAAMAAVLGGVDLLVFTSAHPTNSDRFL